MEEGCQEGAQKRKAEKKGRQTRTVEKEESGVKSLKKWLQASRIIQACMMVLRDPYKDKLGKVSCEAEIVHKSKMKKRTKAGEKGIRWQHNGMKSKNWRRSWNEEG